MVLSDEILGRKPGSWWRFLGAMVLTSIFYMLIIFLIAFAAGAFIAINNIDIEQLSDAGAFTELTIIGIFVFFGIIALIHPALALAIYIFYRRPYLSLVNPLKLRWRKDVLYGAALILGGLILTEILSLIMPNWQSETSYVWDIRTWLIWILPVALIVFLQISAEEMVFRGFMQQYLARLTGRKWVYYGVPSLIWALLHFANYEEPMVAMGFIATTFVMGLIFADWANISGSLIGPLAAHFVNNIFAICIIGSSEEASVMDIIVVDISANSDAMKAVYLLVFTFALCVVYYYIRPRIIAGKDLIARID